MTVSSEIHLGDKIFDSASGVLRTEAGDEVNLRFQASEVLKLLAAAPGQVVARDTFLDRIWQGRQGGEEGLVQCIAEIRRVLGDRDRKIIETIPRHGYKLTAFQPATPLGSRRTAWTIAAASLLAAILVAGTFWARQPGPSEASRVAVAVLPFEDLGSAGPATSLGDSVSGDIINSLARYSEFDVIAQHSSFSFRESQLDLRDVASRLGADFLVQGSHVVQDRTLRISVQLIDAENRTTSWADRFEVPLEDMFEVNDTIAYRIAHEVSSSVVAINAAAPRSKGQVDALILDNRVRVLFQSAPRRDSWFAALALTEQSIEEFPESEWGYLGRALMLRVGVRFGWSNEAPEDLLTEAETLAQRALELGPQNYMTHFALGRVLMQRGEIGRSVAALEGAAALNPSSIIVLNALAQAYIYSDRLDDVDRVWERIARIDPIQDPVSLWMRAWADWQGGDCDDALAAMQAMPVIPTEAMKLLAVVHVCRGDAEAASIAAHTFLDRYPDWTLAREVETNARNWTTDEPRNRWLAALTEVGIPD